LDHGLLLKDIAKDLYMEDLFNLGQDSKNRDLKPNFDKFLAGLDLFVTCNRYDN
jgi:hypothetical protein